MFHTALLLSQGNNTSEAPLRYWTIEFDFTGDSVIDGTMPHIDGSTLTWHTDVRYCLTEGIYWGRDHWTETFETVFKITAQQAQNTLQYMSRVNATGRSGPPTPQYQLWRVEHTTWTHPFGGKALVEDQTCATGIVWLLNYIRNELHVNFEKENFRIRGSQAIVGANRLQLVDPSNAAQWEDVVDYYIHYKELAENVSMFKKVLDVKRLFLPAKYVYDANADKYYKVIGNHLPWIRVHFAEIPLHGPGGVSVNNTAANLVV